MPDKPSMSPTTFVVTAIDRKATPKLENPLWHIEPLDGHPGRYILSLKTSASGAKTALRQVRKALGEGFEIEHVLVDEHGNSVVPTGKITVRFHSPPSDRDLQEFAGPLGLTVDSRNDYVPSQVSFRAVDRERATVPEILAKIQEDEGCVQKAWPETLGRYRRG